MIPFDFQYQLSLNHSVGRVYFDRLEDFSAYAQSVVRSENLDIELPKRACFFAVRHETDATTELVYEDLVEPMVKELSVGLPGWDLKIHTDTTKSALRQLWSNPNKPQFTFITAHGFRSSPSNPRQKCLQGALVCQDWPGPASGPVDLERHLFSAEDIDFEEGFANTIQFLFSSDSAGTPRFDSFPGTRGESSHREPRILAEEPFISRLPQRLLGHEAGGALAVIGHVDRNWTTSFAWTISGRKIRDGVLHEICGRLLRGKPVGWAMRPMVRRYASMAAQLGELLQAQQVGENAPEDVIAALWTAQLDARNYIILGDPAVHLYV